MKQYIKDNKIYNLPICITENDTLIYTNDEIRILAAGYTEYKKEVVKPVITLEQLIQESDAQINAETDTAILNEFIFKDNEFYLTLENQTNFANMYIAREHLTFPQMVKTKAGFYEIKDIAECEEFYLAGINFVKSCIENRLET